MGSRGPVAEAFARPAAISAVNYAEARGRLAADGSRSGSGAKRLASSDGVDEVGDNRGYGSR